MFLEMALKVLSMSIFYSKPPSMSTYTDPTQTGPNICQTQFIIPLILVLQNKNVQ